MQALELVLLLLAVAAGLHLLAERLFVPTPALLVVGGLVLSFVPGLPRVEFSPDVVFLIFVPPLLYRAALTTPFREIRRNWRPIGQLGVVLVLVTMCAVAAATHAILPEVGWPAAFVLGAAVSPPDAVAVTAITRRLGVPDIVVTLLDGESLLNDATAFVAYRMAVAAVVAGTFSIWEAGLRFVWTATAGIAIGFAVGWAVKWVRRAVGRVPVVENTISLVTPFVAFLPSERLGVSSVLAVVTAGLYLAWRGPRLVSPQTRIRSDAMWDMVVFLLEGLIFIIIGLELPVVRASIGDQSIWRIVVAVLAITAAMIFVRLAWTFVWAYLPRAVGGGQRPVHAWRNVFFVGWAGIRGGDSLVIALALPLTTASGAPFPSRDLIILMTFGAILATLVAQGLTLTPIIRLLGLEPDTDGDHEEGRARLKAAEAGLQRLGDVARRIRAPRHVVERLEHDYRGRIETLRENCGADDPLAEDGDVAAYRELRLETIEAERDAIIAMRDRAEIDDDVLRAVQRDLDLEEVLLSGYDEEDLGEETADDADRRRSDL